MEDTPLVQSAEEARPKILSVTAPTTEEGDASEPVVVSASALTPGVRQAEGPQQDADHETPSVYSAEELAPQIRRAEEE